MISAQSAPPEAQPGKRAGQLPAFLYAALFVLLGDIVLFAQITKVVNAPGMKDELVKRGFSTILNTPEQFAEQIKVEVARWKKVVAEGNIKP